MHCICGGIVCVKQCDGMVGSSMESTSRAKKEDQEKLGRERGPVWVRGFQMMMSCLS